jgi:hypothetical protein
VTQQECKYAKFVVIATLRAIVAEIDSNIFPFIVMFAHQSHELAFPPEMPIKLDFWGKVP